MKHGQRCDVGQRGPDFDVATEESEGKGREERERERERRLGCTWSVKGRTRNTKTNDAAINAGKRRGKKQAQKHRGSKNSESTITHSPIGQAGIAARRTGASVAVAVRHQIERGKQSETGASGQDEKTLGVGREAKHNAER
ncbi:uncharacterized protein UTRI_00848 [Ustilago trichophora]|uniref:Uncharacterized protein n=1 Tax=Ustilago trichophora TaxID=86804 RepID=A0A5C3DVY3_9BASI|nr:uncharacterized protein UTRI_00848 [Ustilago trichophora]